VAAPRRTPSNLLIQVGKGSLGDTLSNSGMWMIGSPVLAATTLPGNAAWFDARVGGPAAGR
jgi:hypothetical protein